MTRLQYLRENQTLTQAELGKLLGLSHDAVHTWEIGKRYPRRKNAIKLVKFFDAPYLEWLFEDVNIF